jgi:hypothetical protein
MIPWQNNSDGSINTTKELRSRPVSLVVNRDRNGYAEGKLFLDKNNTISELTKQEHEYYTFQMSANSIHKINENPKSNASGEGAGL